VVKRGHGNDRKGQDEKEKLSEEQKPGGEKTKRRKQHNKRTDNRCSRRREPEVRLGVNGGGITIGGKTPIIGSCVKNKHSEKGA